MTKKISKKNVSDVSKDSNANKAEKPETFEMSEASIDLFHDPDNVAYVTYKFGKRTRTSAVNSSEYRNFIRHSAWKQGAVLKKSEVNEIIAHYEARAQFEGEEHPVYLRVGAYEENIFVDLCNDEGQAVEITKQGWNIVNNPACKFRRAPGMTALPTPTKAGNIDELDQFLNLEECDRILFLSVLLAAFRFGKPTPITLITGEHGSGKTTLARIFRRLTDPSVAPVQTASGNERDLQIACSNSWVMNIDNQSKLSDSMSDNLCRLATGSGLRTRTLYTDNDEKIFSAIRPILMNSIEELATRPDFLDRTVHLHTVRIKKRMNESIFWKQFKHLEPGILGALFATISAALKNLHSVPTDNLQRMADYATWSMAGAPALGFTPEQFLDAYKKNRQASIVTALDASPIYLPLCQLLDGQVDGVFKGSTKELLNRLEQQLGITHRVPHDWPRNERHLAAMLDRITPNLRIENIEIKRLGRDPLRRVQILEVTKSYSEAEIAARKTFDAPRVAAQAIRDAIHSSRKQEKVDGYGLSAFLAEKENSYV